MDKTEGNLIRNEWNIPDTSMCFIMLVIQGTGNRIEVTISKLWRTHRNLVISADVCSNYVTKRRYEQRD
jgi:hypothetical protein